jgi:hypothetical protein
MNARRLILAVLAVVLGVLALTSAVALAAAPETPEVLAPSPLTASTATLHGVLNPGQAGAAGTFELDAYEFVYRPSTAESPGCRGAGEVVDPGLSLGEGKEKVSQAIEGLTPGTEYTVCVVVHNEAGDEEAASAPVTFTTPAVAPRIEESFVSDVASTSATLNARVNPQGAETSYAFEYAPAGGSFVPVPEPEGSGSLPASDVGALLSVHMQRGLTPGASYEFRVVASNSVQKGVAGEAVFFATQHAGGEFVLPDGREYEMVTPPEKEGALFVSLEKFFTQPSPSPIKASVSGNAIVDLASQPTEAEPEGYNNEVAVLSSRGSTGWSSRVIAPPHTQLGGHPARESSELLLFSEDLSHGLVQPVGEFSPYSPEASEQTPYLYTADSNGDIDERCQSSCFQPLVTRGNTREGVLFGGDNGHRSPPGVCDLSFECGPELVNATADLSHVVLTSLEQLTPTPAEEGSLYEWYGGHLQVVSVLPGEEQGQAADLPGAEANSFGTLVQLPGGSRTVSQDGERIIFDSLNNLYLRDVAKGETLQIASGYANGGGAEYITANSDASRVFFLDAEDLTSNSGGVGNEPDLYECDIVEVDGKLKCDLSDLTPPLRTGGEPANVKDVLGVGDNGSYVYFAAGGALTPGAAGKECTITTGLVLATCNIYVRHDGVTSLVASGWIDAYEAQKWARVSPDGRWLAFMSEKSLTGYDNRDANSGEPDAEVYLYDADTDRLTCASCDPTGARPVGVNDGPGVGSSGWVAANVPNWTRFRWFETLYQSRYLSDSGRLFFESVGALVPRDVNGVGDVYEWEPEGVPAGEHACSSASTSGSDVFKPAHAFAVEGRSGEEGGGCVALISAGTSTEESSFLDASETGGDVFFQTTSRLAPQDFDDAPDIYDAHECTGESPCIPPLAVSPPACSTEASCKAPPAPQPAIYGLPSSATFSGSGNIATPPLSLPKKVTKKTVKCRRGFVKGRRGKCVMSKKKTRARKASDDRRVK